MFLHLTSFFERQSPWFFKQPRRQTNLPNIVHKPAQVRESLLSVRQTQAMSDVSCVDRHRGGVAGGVSIAGI
jgi:hypothetical protein